MAKRINISTTTTAHPQGAANTLQKANAPSVKRLAIVLALLTFVIYANTLLNSYVLDDATVITKNTIVTQGIKGIPELLVTSRLKGFTQTNNEESYRPIPMVMYAIEYQLFGANAAEGHLFNILTFTACVVALFIFLNKLFLHKIRVAFAATLLFAVHPIHTEVVANIKSRDELLCFLCSFLALILFTNYAQQGKGHQLIMGAAMLLLSLLSKETSIVFIAIIPLIFFFYINDTRKRSILITAATVVALLCFLTVRALVLSGHHGNHIVFLSNPLIDAPFASRIPTAIWVLGMYIKLLVIPYPLICDYSYNTIPLASFGNAVVLASLAAYIFLALFSIYRLFKKPKDPWAFGILFFLAAIALFSNIPFLVYSEMAERFLFFASAGFCICIALVYEWLATRKDKASTLTTANKPAFFTFISLCVILSILSMMRNADWKDNYTLFTTDLKKVPDNCELSYYVATEISQNRYPEETDPATKQAMNNESIAYLTRAAAIYPRFDEAHAQLGRIYEAIQLFDSAIYHNKLAVSINPANDIATYNLAREYHFLKQYPEAITYYKQTIALEPDVTTAYLNLARCYISTKQYDSAIIYFNKDLTLEPGSDIAQKGIAFAQYMKNTKDSTNSSTSTK